MSDRRGVIWAHLRNGPYLLSNEEVDEIAAAIRATREYAAGAAFAVPIDARQSHSAALAQAAHEVLAGQLADTRRAAKIALGMFFVASLIAALRR